MIQSVLANIAIGLVTSLLGGGFVWLRERAKRARAVNRRAAFFGVRPGQTCLMVLGNKHNSPGTAHHRDVRAVLELALLAAELDCGVSLESGNFRGSNGDRTEFCVGGPSGNANLRTGGHLATHMPGVVIHPYDATRADSVAIEVGGEKFLYDKGNKEYALVAKFTPAESVCPVFLVAGQTSVANLAAIHFLRREYAQVARQLSSVERFCVMIKVSNIGTYDFHRANLEREVTAAAFGE
ncbi:hypothetical protein FBY35_3638 [Streptomyces sp. SLBN-118]|uniref:hypothetical protein n=1 Tax=Streptomyces sp. SLBN-118 TaxID=2768454 RepID=UPI001169D837|nr:hypothetical protein [Streptomyces sp. SLBN-118]TQK53159.1 hypothetical protein FBY35_3638 [Streptomyces sp. SLBN-118]